MMKCQWMQTMLKEMFDEFASNIEAYAEIYFVGQRYRSALILNTSVKCSSTNVTWWKRNMASSRETTTSFSTITINQPKARK